MKKNFCVLHSLCETQQFSLSTHDLKIYCRNLVFSSNFHVLIVRQILKCQVNHYWGDKRTCNTRSLKLVIHAFGIFAIARVPQKYDYSKCFICARIAPSIWCFSLNSRLWWPWTGPADFLFGQLCGCTFRVL